MTEIRSIRADEATSFLRLLCDVFNLDYTRARSIFFNEPFFNVDHKWALFEDDVPVSILTTVPLGFGWGQAVGIAGVATKRERQGCGLATKLLEVVLDHAHQDGVKAAFLFARDSRVYDRIGFELLDEAVYAPVQGQGQYVLPSTLSYDEVRKIYDAWSLEHPDRLRRDEKRWDYWKWNLRVCTAHGPGYLSLEGDLLREVVPGGGVPPWPLPAGVEWFGLRSMAALVGAPIREPRRELLLMGWRASSIPQFFMTDQF